MDANRQMLVTAKSKDVGSMLLLSKTFRLSLCLLLIFCVGETTGQSDRARATTKDGSRDPLDIAIGVCESIDIRNDLSYFEKLSNCSVIEGKLSIQLIDKVDFEKMDQLSFPKLVEITDYLLLYRVQGLKSLRNLFPNLTVIRGQNLLYAYSLVAFEMPHLEELGLVNLTTMERGAVRLEKNPNLCYTHTVDWTLIAKSAKPQDHYIKGNKNLRECVQFCPDNCPSTRKSVEYPGVMIQRCWTVNNCQRMCSDRCASGFCSQEGTCCDHHCVGGCTGNAVGQCIACKDVDYDGICQGRCPPETYLFKKRRCLTREQCLSKCGDYLLVEGQNGTQPAQCTEQCPNGYHVNKDKPSHCTKCEGKCPKICPASLIDSVSAAQRLKGCTVIGGPLEIQLMGGTNIGQELEDSLGQIEEITDYLKISRSYPLLSLHFFKNLRVIRGEHLLNDKYAFFVLDNRKLQELFVPEVQKNMEIKMGLVFFHYNRKLCYGKIEEFTKAVKLDSATSNSEDISQTSNGDQATCSMKNLTLVIKMKGYGFAVLEWTNFNQGDQRHLLRYVVSYREAKGNDMDIYQGRDACTIVWHTIDVEPDSNQNASVIRHFMYSLKPYTVYAVYVETYMISGANTGAMSKIVYFRTEPKEPEKPDNLRAQAVSHSSLKLTWEPPRQPNGNVTHYKIFWNTKSISNKNDLDRKNFCKEPWEPPELEEEEEEINMGQKNMTTVVKKEGGGTCCACPKTKEILEKEEAERQLQIEFENSLHDSVYQKRGKVDPFKEESENKCSSRKKRSAVDPFYSTVRPAKGQLNGQRTKNKVVTPAMNTSDVNDTDTSYIYHDAEVFNTYFIITNLNYYTDYSIQIMACQEKDPSTGKQFCGVRDFITARTTALKSADDIPLDTVRSERKNKTDILIRWEPPPKPNGFIITYEIEYRRAVDDVKADIICVRQQDYRKHDDGYLFTTLEPGNYTYRLRVRSLAGAGDWTDHSYFIVPAPSKPPGVLEPEQIIAIAVSAVIIVIILTIVIVWLFAKSRFEKNDLQYTSVNPGYMPIAYTPDEWEIERDKIKLLEELGQGSFGMVYKGEYNDGSDEAPRKVAVKTLNDHATHSDRGDFLQEASFMKKFVCHHVVYLIGVVSKSQPTFVIMELMENGDLKNFLRKHRPDEEENLGRQIQVKEILQMAGEIADGMAYLDFKKFVHRDLAARNCMVAIDMTVKIGDFGMTRDIYETDYYRKRGKGLLPVRWMPPESLKDGKYSSKSDVWSYGVVLWEMATLAAQPYQGLANEQVLNYVVQGKIMEKPERCPDKIYNLMLKCWQYKPKYRPSFAEIIETLIPDLNTGFKDVSYFFSDENHPESREPYGDELDDQLMDGDIDAAHIPLTNSHGELEPMQFEMRTRGLRGDGGIPNKGGDKEECRCVLVEEGACADPRRCSVTSNPTSAISMNNDSKCSSKSSSNDSYAHTNGVANGHPPFPQTTLC